MKLLDTIRPHIMRTILLIGMVLMGQLSHADIAVIANANFEGQLDQESLKMLYLGKAKHLSNKELLKIKPLNLPFSNAMRSEFDKNALGKTEANLRTYWARMIFTSRSRPPRELGDEAAILKYIKNNDNTIAYIDSKKVPVGFRILLIIKTRS